jgi:alpha-tubulin suppressor-like RCC1 family protein
MYFNSNSYSFVLTSNHAVLTNGNFAGLYEKTEEEFIDLQIQNLRVSSMSCGESTCLFLTNDGMVYSWGRDENKTGVMGLGTKFAICKPIGIDHLIDFT